jgi:hypothetical protein
MTISILVTALVAALLELVMHWFPWRLMLRRDLHRTAAYVLGTLGIAVPLTALFAYWGQWVELLALWAVVVAAGVSVLVAYAFDALVIKLARGDEAQEMLDETRSPQA